MLNTEKTLISARGARGAKTTDMADEDTVGFSTTFSTPGGMGVSWRPRIQLPYEIQKLRPLSITSTETGLCLGDL